VVLNEPLYDSYLPIVRRAGGIPKLVRLEPPTWSLPREELTAAFSDRTKLILFNTPMNPCSKVFDRDELDFIAGLCLRHDAYAVCDEVVDAYEAVAEELQEDVDEVEISVFSEERTSDAARIYVLKRELAEVRRAVYPLRDPINRFVSGGVRGIHADAGPYFRDVGDHLARVSETIDSLDSLLSTAFEAHMAQISIQQNDDMRKISAAVGLVAAPTLIAGVYGMNFNPAVSKWNMPELNWRYGYPFALGLMLAVGVGMYWWFRWRGYLARLSIEPTEGEREKGKRGEGKNGKHD